MTPEYCLDIIQKFEVSEENKKQNVLGIEGNVSDFAVSFVLIYCSGLKKAFTVYWCSLYHLTAIGSCIEVQQAVV